MSSFRPLALTDASSTVHLVSAEMLAVPQVTLDDAASTVITDLRHVATLTVPADTRIDAALERMIHGGVRLLFVVDRHFAVLGLTRQMRQAVCLGERPRGGCTDLAHPPRP